MRQMRMDRMLLGISVGGFLLMSISFLLMPVEAMGLMPGSLFWIGLIVGGALQVVLEIRRRAFFKAYKVKREKIQKPRNGLLTFHSNQAARIIDGIMIVSFIAMILAFLFTKGYGVVCYFLIATTVFAFCLHCILNGRIYFHVNNQTKIRQVLELKKANPTNEGEEKK